jgi:DNA-directed RNA polymerase subunit RPC12/RpoP
MIQTVCRNCGKRVEFQSDLAGQRVECPSCGLPLRIPDSQSTVVEDAAFVRTSCPRCGKALEFHQDLAGQHEECPYCQQPVRVPERLHDLAVGNQFHPAEDAASDPPLVRRVPIYDPPPSRLLLPRGLGDEQETADASSPDGPFPVLGGIAITVSLILAAYGLYGLMGPADQRGWILIGVAMGLFLIGVVFRGR